MLVTFVAVISYRMLPGCKLKAISHQALLARRGLGILNGRQGLLAIELVRNHSARFFGKDMKNIWKSILNVWKSLRIKNPLRNSLQCSTIHKSQLRQLRATSCELRRLQGFSFQRSRTPPTVSFWALLCFEKSLTIFSDVFPNCTSVFQYFFPKMSSIILYIFYYHIHVVYAVF